MLDVSGPNARVPSSVVSTTMAPPEAQSNVTVIKVKEVMANASKKASGISKEDTDDEEIEQLHHDEKQETEDLWPDKPVVLYLWRENTAKGSPVMKVLPALTDLKRNEACEISHGNNRQALALSEKGGINSLHFTRHIKHKVMLKVELTCRPIEHQGKVVADNVRLEPFTITLHLNIL